MTGKELRELNWLYDLAYNVVNDANKEYTDEAYQTVKQALELLAKYKRTFEILKDKGIFEFKDYTNMIFLKPEDYIWNGDIIEEMFINVNDEEYELLEEVLGNENS